MHLRTLQRRIRRWRAEYGPEREIWFTQAHRPGEAAQTDFTSTAELGVTIAGQLFVHLLCVTVLPYSNWQWATACLSESLAALRRGVQAALFQLGRVSNGALKRRPEQAVLVRGSRDFADQDEYERFVAKVVRKANASRGPRVVGRGQPARGCARLHSLGFRRAHLSLLR